MQNYLDKDMLYVKAKVVRQIIFGELRLKYFPNKLSSIYGFYGKKNILFRIALKIKPKKKKNSQTTFESFPNI